MRQKEAHLEICETYDDFKDNIDLSQNQSIENNQQ